MSVDYLSIISNESASIVDTYERNSAAPIPWSDRWSVGTVARHVGSTQHVVAQIVEGRPTADFGLFKDLQTPAKDSLDFADWFRSGTASLLYQLSAVPEGETCWSWFEAAGSVGWWARRMAFEALIHRWDTDAASGQSFFVESEVAADGIDEYLDVFVGASRAANGSPAGPTILFECTDRDDSWTLDLSEQGARLVVSHPASSTVQIRSNAEQLLLALWGRLPLTASPGVELAGDVSALDGWSTLVPPM